MAKIIVSFKEKEQGLYDLVKSQGDQSNYMKDALKYYISHKKENAPVVKTEVSGDEIKDIMQGL